MNIMDITIVNVALPTIGRDFHIAPTAVDGVVIAYLVSLAVFIPASGWLGDRFGGKRVLLIAIVVFTLGSALCGLAQNMTELVLFRVVQGAGGGMMAPVGMAMLYRVFPPAERVRAASILTLGTTVAPAVGPVLGGFLVTNFSWRWVFFVNVPIGIAAVVFGALFLERTGAIDAGRFDVPGLRPRRRRAGAVDVRRLRRPARSRGRRPTVIATCVVGAVLLVAFVLVELRTTRPMVDLHLLRDRLFRSTNCVMFLAAAAFLGMLYLIPLYFQDARGLSALQSGLSTFPEAFGVMIGAQFASRLIYPRIGPRRHITGGLLGLAALHARPDPDQRDHQPLVHPRPHVRAGLDDGAGDGAEPGGVLRHDHARVDGAGIDLLQHHAPGRERDRCGRPLHRLDRRRLDPGQRRYRRPPTSRATTSPSSRRRSSPWPPRRFSLTIHDSDAAETIVRRVRGRPAPSARGRDPGTRGQPGVTTLETVCVFCGSSPGADPAFTVAAERFGHGSRRTRHRAGLRRRLGRPDGCGRRRRHGGGRTGHRRDHRVAGRPRDRPRHAQRPARGEHHARAQGAHVRAVGRLRHAARRVRHLRGVHGVRHLGAARDP